MLTLLIFPVLKFHTSMNPSTDPVIKYLPSGEKRAHSTCDRRPNCGDTRQLFINIISFTSHAHLFGSLCFYPDAQRNIAQGKIRRPQGGINISSMLQSEVV